MRPSVRVMNAAWRRVSPLECGVQGGQRQADVDRAADGISDRSARPSVEDHCDVGEVFKDGDIRDVRDPELVRPVNRQVLSAIGVDRLIVIAVGCRHIAAASAGLEIVLAHQSPDLLVIDGQASMPNSARTRRQP